jgi:type I restriction enzyme S subunit
VVEVKGGYKQTEIGVIPNDWDLVRVDKIFTFYSTSNYSKAQMSNIGDVGCVHYGLIHAIPNSKYDLRDGIKYYVNSDQANYEFVKDGDVIMVDASEDFDGVNKSVEVSGVGTKKYISGLHTYLLRDNKGMLVDDFRGIVLNSKTVKNQMLQLAVGMKVFGVSKTQLVNILIPLPPTIKEQEAIANALSTMDNLITNIDALIAKKKAIKKGAMQQLLTPPNKGGKRLSGFSGDWVEKSLGEVVKYQNGKALESFFNKKSGFKVVSIGNYSSEGKYVENGNYISKKNRAFIKQFILNKGDLTMLLNDKTASGNIIGRVLLINEDDKYVFNQRTMRLEVDNSLSNIFMYHFINSEEVHKKLFLKAKPGTQIYINTNDVLDIELILPPTIEEQQAIATILSDMDTGLETLEAKKEKYTQLKQGMAQELLTGKTRLV